MKNFILIIVSLSFISSCSNDKDFFLTEENSLLSCKKAGEIVGLGTGDLYEHLENLKNSKVRIYVSGLSAKSRGYDEKLLEGYNAEFAMPDVLVDESIKADSVLCY